METTPRYSLILPIFDVESQISRCIWSLISQTDQDFELILVDDGGADKSVEIAEKILKENGREYVLLSEKDENGRAKNQGAAAARNLGIRAAAGDWIQTLDSDDYLDTNAVKNYKRAISAYPDADFIYSEYQTEKAGTERKPDVTKQVELKTFYGRPLLKAFYLRKEPIAAPACVFKKSIATEQNVWFPEGCTFSEDMYFVYQLLFVTKKAVKLEAKLYHYVERDDSTMRSSGVERIMSGYRKFMSLDAKILWAYEKRTGDQTEDTRHTGFGIDLRNLFPRWILAVAHTASKVLPYREFKELLTKMHVRSEMAKLVKSEHGRVKTAAWVLSTMPHLFYTVMKLV